MMIAMEDERNSGDYKEAIVQMHELLRQSQNASTSKK